MNIKGNQIPLDIVEEYPETMEAFHSYDEVLGKCLLCHHLFDSLDVICQEYDLDLTEMLATLKGEAKDKRP